MQVDKKEKTPSLEHGLRSTTPDAIADYLHRNWDGNVAIQRANPGEKITVPQGWHGEGKAGDVQVLFGKLLTEPIAGTVLTTFAMTSWMAKEQGFTFETRGKQVDASQAAELLDSDQFPNTGEPLVRMVSSLGVPKILEFYSGARSQIMQTISEIGNRGLKSQLNDYDRDTYVGMFSALYRPFIAKGTTAAKERMSLSQDISKIRRLDDVVASDATFAGDKWLYRSTHTDNNYFDVSDAGIVTLQGTVIEIFMADKLNTPLLLRAGAPALGLAGHDRGLNYIHNVHQVMLAHGNMTCGDVGDIFDKDGIARSIDPHIAVSATNGNKNQTRLFLGGGLRVGQIMMEHWSGGKAKQGREQITYLRATRIDSHDGDIPTQWGVLFTDAKSQ